MQTVLAKMRKILDRGDGSYYTARTLNAGAPLIDAGEVDDVFERAGLEPNHGANRKVFRGKAKGKKVLRVGFDMVILGERDVNYLIGQLWEE